MNEDGQTSSIKDKILTIDVKPGWREGTKIIFPREGDQVHSAFLCCIQFLLFHPSFGKILKLGEFELRSQASSGSLLV